MRALIDRRGAVPWGFRYEVFVIYDLFGFHTKRVRPIPSLWSLYSLFSMVIVWSHHTTPDILYTIPSPYTPDDQCCCSIYIDSRYVSVNYLYHR